MFGCGLQVTVSGSCVVVSCADGAGAVRRDYCGDCEADAYTAQETVVSQLSFTSIKARFDQGHAVAID